MFHLPPKSHPSLQLVNDPVIANGGGTYNITTEQIGVEGVPTTLVLALIESWAQTTIDGIAAEWLVLTVVVDSCVKAKISLRVASATYSVYIRPQKFCSFVWLKIEIRVIYEFSLKILPKKLLFSSFRRDQNKGASAWTIWV
ncbi:hypothetical protein D9757_012466 [Collybiopsis confluens]|uniref:Uncharacterized protein n=1 Tax=Collybiopsis confluens TaxID=2823264 RepID=A0A8H5G1B3_9AGAR|nr:hypothetical protein D9757_012466 [Collybiopsis confluens]